MTDLTSMTDGEFQAHHTASLIEQERRANLAQIPAMIQELATKYKEGGGDQQELLKAVGEHE